MFYDFLSGEREKKLWFQTSSEEKEEIQEKKQNSQ